MNISSTPITYDRFNFLAAEPMQRTVWATVDYYAPEGLSDRVFTAAPRYLLNQLFHTHQRYVFSGPGISLLFSPANE